MRTRRIAAVLATVVAALATSAVLGGWTSRTTAGVGSTAGSNPPVVILDPPQRVGDDVRVYAAALKDWRPVGTIRVYDRFCFRGEQCTSRPLPVRIRVGLSEVLAGRVRFVDSAARSITLDPAHIAGPTAQLRLQESCGPMCIEGEGITLTRSHGVWRVTGTRSGWIS